MVLHDLASGIPRSRIHHLHPDYFQMQLHYSSVCGVCHIDREDPFESAETLALSIAWWIAGGYLQVDVWILCVRETRVFSCVPFVAEDALPGSFAILATCYSFDCDRRFSVFDQQKSTDDLYGVLDFLVALTAVFHLVHSILEWNLHRDGLLERLVLHRFLKDTI